MKKICGTVGLLVMGIVLGAKLLYGQKESVKPTTIQLKDDDKVMVLMLEREYVTLDSRLAQVKAAFESTMKGLQEKYKCEGCRLDMEKLELVPSVKEQKK